MKTYFNTYALNSSSEKKFYKPEFKKYIYIKDNYKEQLEKDRGKPCYMSAFQFNTTPNTYSNFMPHYFILTKTSALFSLTFILLFEIQAHTEE